MRQGQQNRRGRGRGNNNNNNNRKGQNPLTRSFESNGPDMKIRGTPAHVAEKYMSLARDALSSGDPVLAENYLQHAEHYNRIILTFREQQAQNSDTMNGSANARNRSNGNGQPRESDRAGSDTDAPVGSATTQPDAPQPDIQSDNAPRERTARGQRANRQDGGRSSRSRNPSGQRASSSRASGANGNSAQKNAAGAQDAGPGPQRDRFGDTDEQPQFLRRPVRRSRTEQTEETAADTRAQPAATGSVDDDSQD